MCCNCCTQDKWLNQWLMWVEVFRNNYSCNSDWWCYFREMTHFIFCLYHETFGVLYIDITGKVEQVWNNIWITDDSHRFEMKFWQGMNKLISFCLHHTLFLRRRNTAFQSKPSSQVLLWHTTPSETLYTLRKLSKIICPDINLNPECTSQSVHLCSSGDSKVRMGMESCWDVCPMCPGQPSSLWSAP